MTSFEYRVYRAVLSIPVGQVKSYKWVARKAGSPRAYRAVGSILKKNPFPIIIPCHRVIKSNKMIGDYAWGRKTKKKLLSFEKEMLKWLASRG